MRSAYANGFFITCAGVLLLTPDALLIKLAGSVGAIESTLLRSLFMAISWAIMLSWKRGAVLRPLLGISRIGLLSAVLLAADRLVFVAAVQSTTIANTLSIAAAVPAFAAVLAFFLLRERTGWLTWLSIGTSLLGVYVILGEDAGAQVFLGNAFATLSALLFALYIICLRVSHRDEVLETLSLSGILGALATLPFSDLGLVGGRSLLIVSMQGLLLLPVGFGLYIAGTRHLPAAHIALIGLLEPVFGPFWAWAVLGEAPSQRALAGASIVLLAVCSLALGGLLQGRRQLATSPPS